MKVLFFFLMFLLIGITSCKKIEEPKFENIQNFKIKQVGLSGTEVGFDVGFYNPNNFGLNVKEAGCNVYIDSIYMGQFRQDAEINVVKQSKFIISLTGTIPLQTALKVDITKYLNKEVSYRADGSVKVGKAGVYITKPFNLKGTQKIQL